MFSEVSSTIQENFSRYEGTDPAEYLRKVVNLDDFGKGANQGIGRIFTPEESIVDEVVLIRFLDEGCEMIPLREGEEAAEEYEKAFLRRLQRLESGESLTRRGLFFGFQSRPKLYAGLGWEGERATHVLEVTLNRAGLEQVVKENIRVILLFGGLLFLVGFVLARLLSTRFTRPIRRLAGTAGEVAAGNLDARFPRGRQDELGSLSDSLNSMTGEIQRRVEAMEVMNLIDKAVLSSISRSELLDRVLGFITERIPGSAAVIAIHRGKGEFEIISSTRKGKEAPAVFIPEQDLSTEFHITGGRSAVPAPYHDFFPEEIELAALTGIPITVDNHFQGALLLAGPDLFEFNGKMQETLRMLADQVGVAFRSVRAVEEYEALNLASITALTRTVDAKSKWTAGHSERVAELSERLAESAGLSEMDRKKVRISALLHDIGKIGVSEQILDKPGRLTGEEFARIKEHPVRGVEILQDLPNYGPVRGGVLSHHERWDGSGYPEGLEGDAIPFYARIIALADVWDAITDDRPYRKGMDFHKATEFMKAEGKRSFDPDLLELFLPIVSLKR
ncbi:MAG: HD domain-containing protein [Spirochaetales bacterium]|nr:HD domain-containing protein [Spirochaetales bacterium]MCF7937395.1 HD domain-containing protein [Spirochaetales bacterium]